MEVHAEQLEYPPAWSFLSKGTFFHNPNVSDEKFQEIIKEESDKNDESNWDE